MRRKIKNSVRGISPGSMVIVKLRYGIPKKHSPLNTQVRDKRNIKYLVVQTDEALTRDLLIRELTLAPYSNLVTPKFKSGDIILIGS